MNEVVNLSFIPSEAVKERLETNVIRLSNIKYVEKGATIYDKPAKDIIPADNDRLAHVDAAYDYIMSKGYNKRVILPAILLVMAGFVAGFVGHYFLADYINKIIM